MKDQYSFLKAIDTSSSSPELILDTETTRHQQASVRNKKLSSKAAMARANGQATASSSSINGSPRTLGDGLRSKIQNLVKPIRFQQQQQQQHRQQASAVKSLAIRKGAQANEKVKEIGPRERFFSSTSKSNGDSNSSSGSRSSSSSSSSSSSTNNNDNDIKEVDKKEEQMMQVYQQQQHRNKANKILSAPKQSRNRDSTMAPNLNSSTTRNRPQVTGLQQHHRQHQHSHHHNNHNQQETSTSGTTTAINASLNYLPSETQAAVMIATTTTTCKRHEPELVKCYEEIDQIYDYIRGLAPLPINLRKIKSIDFEQLERERQKLAEKQQQQQQQQQQLQVQHHQHRRRYVSSIENSPSSHSAGSSSVSAKRLVKVRQRNPEPDLLHDDKKALKPPPPQQQQQQQQPLERAAPMPIRVTTMTSESYKPSIKRVESLNLGQLSRPLNGTEQKSSNPAPFAKLLISGRYPSGSSQCHVDGLPSKPSYLISTTQRGQIFRLPRAHSTSTLNKQPLTLLSNNDSSSSSASRRASRAATTTKEPVIQEDLPLTRLSSSSTAQDQHQDQHQHHHHHHRNHHNHHQPIIASNNKQKLVPQTRSLGRSMNAGAHTVRHKKRFSFESDLVESFVDDEEESGTTRVLGISPKINLRGVRVDNMERSPQAAALSSSSSGQNDELKQRPAPSSDSSSSSSSSSSSTSSEFLTQKSHSDYDNDSDENSESTTTVTSDTTTTDTSNCEEGQRDNEKDGDKEEGDHEEGDEEGKEALKMEARRLKRDRRSQTTKATLSSISPFSAAGSAGTGKRSQRPTTSSSPSSGRPASPAEETNDDSDELATSTTAGHIVTTPTSLNLTQRHQHQRQQRSSPLSYKQMLPRVQAKREEHIYEQIPAHKGGLELYYQQQPSSRRMSSLKDSSTTRATLASGGAAGTQSSKQTSVASIKHPVAYAANVAVNRRYQQQVAALFELQQQRDRALSRRQSQITNEAPQPRVPPASAAQLYHGHHHQRRASASNASQFMIPWKKATTSTRQSEHNNQQRRQQLADVPHRHRLSMGNIHLLASALPLASLYPSPKQRARVGRTSEKKERRSSQNTNSLDDHEACSTGTTNSTSSYEAAIKNSEPNPLRIDMLGCVQQQESDSRLTSGRRSVGSGSGSRSLTNHLQMHSTHLHNQHNQQQQQSSTLVKVPKLSKQSHLLQRPLPKPPNYRSNKP